MRLNYCENRPASGSNADVEGFVGVLQGIADVILILAALFSAVAFAFLAYAGWTIVALVKDAKGEVQGLTQTAKDTLETATDTGHFVTDQIVKPAFLAFGFASAIRATVKALTEDVVRKKRT
jgi:TRAP-type C4-dicarboxylate transport system permease small subunit